jgi:putative GTP pyrophosphokinase
MWGYRLMAILDDFDSASPVYKEFTGKLRSLIENLLKINNVRFHIISSRLKTRSSLERKYYDNVTKYLSLDAVTDLAGVRIITYFEDEVHKAADVVQREFDIDTVNSSNKKDLLDPDRFGYLSLHYVVKINAERLGLTEYKAFGSCKAEIQIRSILQHAWAEIEHNLGYRSKITVPREIRRRFSRIASILELVDQEFIGLRDDIVGYSETIKAQITNNPEHVEINKDAIAVYLFDSPVARRVDNAISEILGIRLVDQRVPAFYEDLVEISESVGIKTIADLDRALIENERLIMEFSREYDRQYPTGQKNAMHMVRGGAITYASLVLISKTNDPTRIRDYVDTHRNFRRPEKRAGFVDFLQRTLSIVSNRIAADGVR